MKKYIIILILFCGNYVYAYDYNICPLCDPDPVIWSQSPTFYVHNSLGYTGNCVQFPMFVADYRHEINCATKAFNDLGSSNINISTITDNEFITDDFQDESDVGFAPHNHFDDDTIALTHRSFNCLCGINTSMEEADIKFDWSIPWLVGSIQPSNYTYEQNYSFRQTALHEIGHALGLDHYSSVPTVMNSNYIFGGWYRGDNWSGTYDDQFGYILPHADDANGMNDLYGNSYVGRDIAMNRGRIVNGKPEDLPFIFQGNPPGMCPGQFISITYTIENRGNEYLSTVPVRTFFPIIFG